MSDLKKLTIEFLRFAAVATSCAVFGAGVGLMQGEIVARGDDKIYQITFAGGAAMVGGLIAFFLGPILFYALNRQLLFERFCYIGVSTLLTGCLIGWFLARHPNGPGWASMFATPIAAIVFAILFSREHASKVVGRPG